MKQKSLQTLDEHCINIDKNFFFGSRQHKIIFSLHWWGIECDWVFVLNAVEFMERLMKSWSEGGLKASWSSDWTPPA